VSPAKLTRKEKQAQTRAALMRSAAKVFADRGLERGSIDEVAEDAGYTKGAFYANFASKEELLLAMLDERFEERLAEVERAAESEGELQDQVRRAGTDFNRYVASDPRWQRLFFEFTTHAVRDDGFRRELVARYRELREGLAAVYKRWARQEGVEPPVPVDQIALMTFAMANGMALERLLEPDAVSDELYPTMLGVFFAGLRAMVEEAEPVGT
jgi:AcrR family transcriptional regulator